jgi:hypothetical protein
MQEQSTLKKEVELQEKRADLQEKELEDMRREAKEMKDLMAQLTKQAATDAKKESDEAKNVAENATLCEQRKGNYIALAGGVSTVLIAILSSVVTYYTSNCGHQSSYPNSTGT